MLSIGICTSFSDLPELQGLGFDYAEISLSALAALPESDFQEFAAYVDGAGIRVPVLSQMLPDDLPVTGPAVSAATLHGYLNHAFNRARRLGASVVVLDAAASRAVPEDGDFPFAWRQLGNFLRLAQGHAAECGLSVAVEPLRKTDCALLNLVSEATLMAGLLQLDNVGVAAHSGHMAMASEPMSALRQAAPLLKHVHVEGTLSRRLPAEGDGEDYTRLLRTLQDIGYAGGVSVCGKYEGAFKNAALAALIRLRTALSGAPAGALPGR